MTDQNNNYETYREWLDGFISRKVDLGDKAETDEDFSVDDLRAYLDLPSEIASIVPFPPPVIDDETVELLGKSFGDGIGYASWQRYYHELNLTYLMRDRDRGVDAVVFDPDPIKGGKTVVQAKRYTNVVEVSAVRDLYGTVMNEGAIKGILVTTSHYGKDAYEFVKGKNLVLIDGSQLLHQLEKHGHKAYINMAEAKKLLYE